MTQASYEIVVSVIKRDGSGMLPAGSITQFYGKGAPPGYLICDGASYKRSSHPELAPLLRKFTPWWRWHLLREFNVPDNRGRDVVVNSIPSEGEIHNGW